MIYQINITRTAEQDLRDAANYIEYVLKNPEAADKLLDLASSHIMTLKTNPKIHAVIDDVVLKTWGIRFIVVGNYLAFYVIDEKLNTVYIIRFLYSKRDWVTILKSDILYEDSFS